MIGRKLAHYTITGKLGEGGMGVVYEATDGHLDRAVALKLLPPAAMANPARKQRFVQEAKAASSLNHPHIVTIYDIATDDGIDYIAMELIRGRTLEQVISRGKLRLPEALKYGAQIADALAAAHAAGIVHRDLKPGNIMVTERGDVKVLDFGLAKLTDETQVNADDETRTQHVVTDEGTVVGSAPYMSPEQAEGRKVDARSDIFSFGSVMYEMLTGQRAFRGANRTATMVSLLSEEPEPISKLVPDMPREVERTVLRCLRKDLDRRSQSMAEIRVALQDLKEEAESGSLLATGVAARTVKHRSRWPLYAGGGALAAAALAAFWFLGSGRPAAPLRAVPLTSFVGYQGTPSLSPDGNQFAFAWDGDVAKGPPHIYISLVGKGSPLRLTPEDQAAQFPAWSPDGQSIAFWRHFKESKDWELVVMPSLGGPGRKIATASEPRAPSWSPDGKWLLWSQAVKPGGRRSSLRAAAVAGGEPFQLLDPLPSGLGDYSPAVSPDGRELAFVRAFGDHAEQLYVAGFQEGRVTGAPRQLTTGHGDVAAPHWTNDGKEILYIEGEPYSELSLNRVNASGGQPRSIEGIGANVSNFSLAAKGNRLIYSTELRNFDIRRADLHAPGAEPERFLSSTRFESSAVYSPDGKRIAFSSNRGGVRQIWIADADGTNISPLTSFSNGIAGSPKWSPDGQTIVFDARPDGNSDIYTVPAAGGAVRRLTSDPAEDHLPTWSPDGQWIYFGSGRAGQEEIFRMHPDGSAVQQITHDGGFRCMVDPDGKWLYYTILGKGLWRQPPEGGHPEQVLAPGVALSSVMVKKEGIYTFGRRSLEGMPVVLYPSDGGTPRTLFTFSNLTGFNGAPEISPDGRWLLFSITDEPVYGIMLVDGFR